MCPTLAALQFFGYLCSCEDSPFRKSDVDRISKVIATASSIIEQGGDARTAAKALKVLSENMELIRQAVTDRRKRDGAETFTFTYEEEIDPEIFFVPYVWEVIVCCATSSMIEWKKERIRVFPLLDDPASITAAIDDETIGTTGSHPTVPTTTGEFSSDVSDIV